MILMNKKKRRVVSSRALLLTGQTLVMCFPSRTKAAAVRAGLSIQLAPWKLWSPSRIPPLPAHLSPLFVSPNSSQLTAPRTLQRTLPSSACGMAAMAAMVVGWPMPGAFPETGALWPMLITPTQGLVLIFASTTRPKLLPELALGGRSPTTTHLPSFRKVLWL
jgi:hypothetical protein